jgi:Fe-S cluster assembly iron-binding protein IscA
MIHVTPAARAQLLQLIDEHPDDPIVRLAIQDLDHKRIAFSVTLESAPNPGDTVYNVDGLQIAVEGASATRLDGITMDYQLPTGFKFEHPPHVEGSILGTINLN